MNIDIEQLQNIIICASKQIISPRFNQVERNYKSDGSIVTEADLLMQEYIESQLKLLYPEIALLGEEMTAQQQQSLLSSGKVLWCLDPIDGTSNFAAGLPYFCVSLALIDNGSISLAIVYDPIRDECFTAQRGKGAYLNGQALNAKKTGLSLQKSIAYIDFKRLSNELAIKLVSSRPYGSQRSLGSIALELCWIAAGRGHVYLHAKQLLWDYAAAQLILAEAGGHACTLEGQPLPSDQLTPCSAIAALDHKLFIQWCDYLAIKHHDHA